MNEQAIQTLYGIAVGEGYTKSIEEFRILLQTNPNGFNQMYDLARQNGYGKDKTAFAELVGTDPNKPEFANIFNPQPTLKKKEPTELPSEDISLDLQSNEYDPVEQARQLTQRQGMAQVPVEVGTFESLAEGITPELISMDQDEAIEALRKKYSPYGLIFEAAGPGYDAVLVSNADGSRTEQIRLDPFTNAGMMRSEQQLKEFIAKEARNPSAPMYESDLTKALSAKNSRTAARKNEDGSVSSHLMMSYEEDGVYKVVPTLFPVDPNNQDDNPNSWIELPPESAIRLAEARGEVYEFYNEEEAQKFAEGAWKLANTIDLEGQQFFAERGFDYNTIKTAREEYDRLSDEIDSWKLPEDFAAKDLGLDQVPLLSSLINLQQEILYQMGIQDTDAINQLEEKRDALYGVISDEAATEALEDWDRYLHNRSEQIASAAIADSKSVGSTIGLLDNISQQEFGMPVDLLEYAGTEQGDAAGLTIPEGKVDLAKALSAEYKAQKQNLEIASLAYDLGSQYFDEKTTKEIRGEFVDNWEGFTNAIKIGSAEGEAGALLTEFAMFGSFASPEDLTEEEKRDLAFKIATKKYEASQTAPSAVAVRSRNARSWGEWWNAVSNDPFEWMTQLAAQSLTQQLQMVDVVLTNPTFATIIGADISLRAAQGAGIIGTATAGTGTAVGGVLGGAEGAIESLALTTGFAMEYVSSIFEVAAEKGYDMTNPDDVYKALAEDASVWEEGGQRGVDRGVPITIVSYLGGRLAGNVVKTTPLDSPITRIAAQTTERATFDPATEGLGELVAQINAGQEINWVEIAAEAGGGMGTNAPMAGVRIMYDGMFDTNSKLSKNLQSTSYVNRLSASDEKIVNWTNKMTKSGVVTEEEGKVITDNVSRRREAQKIIDAQKELEGRQFSRKQEESVRGRVMQLLDMRQTIDNVSESSSDVSGFYSGLQRQITEEIQEIIQTGKLSESPVELLDAVKKREEQFGNFGFVNRQTGEEEELTRDEFLKRIDETSSEDLIAQMEGGVVPFVRGAPETQKILFKKLLNAIQEPGPTEVDARQPAESSPSVGEEVQVTEEEVVQEIEPIRTATKAIKEAYADNTLEPETLDGLLSHIAEKEEQGKALTPFQVTLKNDNQQRLDEIATLRMQAKQEADIQSEVDVLESIVEGLNVSKSRQQISTKEQNTKDDLITRSKNALTAIRTILPDVSIVIHETNEGYNKNVTRNGQNTNGEYNPNTKVIHLNNELINQSGAITTVGHEVFHALVLDAIVNDEQARVLAKNLLNDVKNSVGKRSEIYKRIVDFQERYKDFKDEESLAEFFGILSAYETELPKSVRQKIVDFFNEILKLTGLDKVFKFDNSDIAAIMQSLATKVATGEEITAEEISPISRARERAASKGGKKILGSRQQLSKLYDVARKYNMNTAGFTPRQIDGRAFAQEVRALGYEVRRAKNGSLYIANPDGRGAFNVIEQFDKQRQADLRADRAAREEVAQEERASELSQREREIAAADENAELAAFARLDDQYLETANNLMARSQLASDFTANEIRDFADRGIVSHFAPTNIVEFQPDYISRTLWGYGFYFTNSLKAAQGYGERVTFVDVSDFNILDLDESFENHIDDLATFIENAIAALPEERREEVQFVYDETIKNIENRPSWRALDWGSLFINTPKPNNDYTKIITDYVASLGYDAFALSELDYSNTATFGRNIWTVFNFEKLNDNIVSNPRAIQPRQQLGPEGIDPEAVRRKNRPGGKVSKGLSVKSVKGEKVVEESADLSLDFVKKNAPQAYVKNANIIANYPIVRGSQTFDDITTVEEADKVYSVYSDIVADNLEWLVSNYGEQFVDISKLWYDGANQIANNIADNNPVTVEQAAGIIAALSPQNDWYQNVRAAELLVETFNIDPVMTKAMLNYQSNYAKGKIDEKKKAVKKQMDALKGSRKKADKTKRESIRKAFQKVEEKERKIMAALEGLLGKRMSEVDPMFKMYYVRLYNEVNTTKDYQIIRPDGLKGGPVMTQKGKRRRFGWGSYTEIGKAVSIYLDGSMENITAQLGENHKIRNFHNNIVDPMSEDKDITMDTHAIAAALLIPAASNTTEVKQNFGNPAASSNVGQKGLYYANQEGYFKAAERLGILPREVQSITWEAVRGLFTDTFKKDKKKSNEIYKVWNDYANKEITIDEARQRVLELADGVNDPSWAGLISTEPRSDVRGEAIARRGEADGRDTEREGITPRQQKQIEREMKEENGMLNIIQTGRQANISEEAIRRVLAAKGFPKVEIDAALAVPIDAFTTIPPAFNKVEGGLNESMNLFTEVTDGIRKFMKPKKVRGKDEYTQPTKAEVREKALKLLGDNPIYKEQPRQVQDELMLAVDRMVGTRANKEVQKQISEIRNNLKQRKMATRDLAANQRQLKNFIRENLVGLPDVTISDVNRLINAIDKAKTAEEYIAQATKVLDITDRRRATYQKQLIKEIAQFVIRKGAAKILDSGKRKAPGIDNETRIFFEAAAPILRAAVKGDIDAIAQAAQLLEQNPDLQSAINKELNQENMTLKERKLVNQSIAMSTFGNINNMSVEELLELMNELKSIRKDSIARMKANKLERAKRYAANDEAATIQIRQLFPFLFNEDGSLKDENQLKREKKTIYQKMNEGKVFAGIKDFYEKSSLNTVKGVMKFAGRLLSNLQTITTLLDNEAKGQNFFTETIYKPLARMSENQRRGVFDQQAVLDQIANTIDGVTDGYKQIRSALLIGPVEITLKNGSVDVTSGNQLARIYALSLNEVQARKLEAAGYGPEQLAQVEAALPEEVKQFVEKTVDYLSNTYFETVNDVYESLNDVSLGYVENYFPTRTLSDPSSASIDFKDGKFLDSISTENESALKERTDTTRPVSTEAMFTDVLDLYLDSMERYKAYAEGARTLSKVFATPAVNTLLQEAGIQDLMTQMVGLSINPMAGRSLIDKPMTRIIDRFMGYALAFKAIQLPKQATSFINAFQDYQYRSGKYTPGIDQIMFMYDAARIIMDLPAAIRQAYDTSAEFRYRLEQGFEGDVYGLESGATRFRRVTQNEGRFKAAKAALTGFRKAGVSPTVLGDILGVMGYMINYRRNLKNGISKTEALEAFNEYNPTQQSRRSMDKNALQFSRSELMRAFTSFGSVLFLQYNRVVQSATNISKSIASKQKPSAKDVRALILSYALANVFYQMTGYMFALMKGDKDDEEKAMGAMRKAASGIDMISAIPLIGPAIEYAYARAKGERYYDSQITNPYLSVSKDVAKSIKEKDVADVLKTLTEISLGTNVDPLIGLYNVSEDIVTGDTISDEDFYEMLGVPPSQRPGQ